MKEIEVLVEVYDDIEEIKEKFKCFDYKGLNHTIDEYYYDSNGETLKPDENNQLSHCLRLRTKNDKCFITYKDDGFDNGKWLYSNEYETSVGSVEMMKEIFDRLGFIKFIEINNRKETYLYNDYEIVLEDAKDLGTFMEVEYVTNEDVDVNLVKRQIYDFIEKLNINVSKELNMGKPEMYMRKNDIKIN